MKSKLNGVTPLLPQLTTGWIDWREKGGARAKDWERFIDTSFYAIAVVTGGYDFSFGAGRVRGR